ncbi:hypothetical protein ILUMI_09139 [Ignelater luminosus]|uniref:Enoyl reductase (ER) domain-containing protein n=1 Tax=Ignelater luminosus TaxID=2038154 RepID=A0A8K0D0A9_IGNLU|nr:hypothetical protein ILUMI_09139 [Ignelater luminosus]
MEFCTKAVILKTFGSYNCLTVDKFPLPPLNKKVEVEVHYCGMNFADLYTRQGLMTDCKLPFVLGIECSGVIKNIGNDIENCSLKVGQRVLCYDYQGGMYQDIIRISPEKCYPLPDDISLEDGAAVFVNYLTAYFALFDLGNLKPNETVLIQSCAGGVGCAATQLSKTIEGVKVVGSASQTKEEAAKANGVDNVVSYDNLENQIQSIYPEGLDLIIDNQAGKSFQSLQNLLKPLGRIALIGANNIIQNDKKLSALTLLKAWWNMKEISPTSLIVNNRSVSGLHLGILAQKERTKICETLDTLFVLMREGKIKPKIDSIWPLEDVVTATKILAERCNVGKVLLSINK